MKNKIKNNFKNNTRIKILNLANSFLNSYDSENSERVFFPGCNFAGFLPSTVSKISKKLKENFGISTVYDCCTKPIALLNVSRDKEIAESKLRERIKKREIKEILVICPNCYHHLRKIFDIKISLLYDYEYIMREIISQDRLKSLSGNIFIPCRDKKTREIYKSLEKYINFKNLNELKNINCCGLGIVNIKKKTLKNIERKFADTNGKIFVYCASCMVNIMKSGKEAEHILNYLIDYKEEADTGFKSYKNRLKLKLERRKNDNY